MRVVKEIPHPACKITLFAWNNRYIIKIELGYFEQTFKIDQFDVSGDDEVVKMVDKDFLQQAIERFEKMAISLTQARQRIE
jgi:hypothetical protein